MMKKLLILSILLISTIAHGADVTLAWDANTEPDLAGYKLHYGTTSGNYTDTVDVGNVTTYTVQGLAPGTWYFAATAYDTAGYESGYSNEDKTRPGNPKNLRIIVIINIPQ